MRYRTWYQSAEEKYSPRVCPATPPPPFAPRAAILPSPCLATVRALPSSAFASCRAVARSLRRRRIPAVVLPGGPYEPRAPSLRRRRVPATPPPSSVVATLSLPCLAVALPGHRAHPTNSAVAPRLALSSRLTLPCSAPVRPALPAVILSPPCLQQPCCSPTTAAALLPCHPDARGEYFSTPSSCLHHPAAALPSRRPADVAWLISPCCITRPPCYRCAPLSCHWGSLLLRVTCLAVSTHIPWPSVRLHSC